VPDRSLAADSTALVLSGPRLADGRTVDVRLSGDRIEAVGTPGSLSAPGGPGSATAAGGTTRLDLTGYLLLPAPAEPHAHHDTALTGAATGPPGASPAELRRRITEAALIQLGHGATAQRSHIRIGDVHGLAALDAALAARRTLRGLTALTTVAAPRLLTGRSGADSRALLHEAVTMGADALGGTPDLDPDPAGYIDTVLGAADEHGRPIDLHTEADDPARLARLASAVAACRSGVTIGPCTGLSRMPAEAAGRAADQLAAAGVTVACLPQGRCSFGAYGTGTPVRLLASAGVRVAAGGGTLRDAANPVGRGDPLEAAYLLASLDGIEPHDAYDAVSCQARAALGLPEVRIDAGFPAELLAVRGESVAGALSLAYSRLVIHRGRIVARTSAVREYGGAPSPPPASSASSGSSGSSPVSAAAQGLPRQATGECT
jgi:cytosine/creatinine deaminase